MIASIFKLLVIIILSHVFVINAFARQANCENDGIYDLKYKVLSSEEALKCIGWSTDFKAS
tara:strand:- start:84 stop:266 length:183 start_codon:yes stop_codon:yes gene_type:complete